jgi:hypothetical protein
MGMGEDTTVFAVQSTDRHRLRKPKNAEVVEGCERRGARLDWLRQAAGPAACLSVPSFSVFSAGSALGAQREIFLPSA